MTIPTFPTLSGLSYPVKRTPSGQRFLHKAVSGKSTRQSPQPYATYAYDLPFEFLRSDTTNHELQTLMSFFQFCLTLSQPFHFSDPSDNAVTGQAIGTGDGVTTDFALVRTMASIVDPVQDAVAAGLKVYVNGVQKTLTTDYTLLTTSLYGTIYGVHFVAAPPNGAALTVDMSYNWLCDFSSNSVEFSQFMNTVWEAGSVKFESILQ